MYKSVWVVWFLSSRPSCLVSQHSAQLSGFLVLHRVVWFLCARPNYLLSPLSRRYLLIFFWVKIWFLGMKRFFRFFIITTFHYIILIIWFDWFQNQIHEYLTCFMRCWVSAWYLYSLGCVDENKFIIYFAGINRRYGYINQTVDPRIGCDPRSWFKDRKNFRCWIANIARETVILQKFYAKTCHKFGNLCKRLLLTFYKNHDKQKILFKYFTGTHHIATKLKLRPKIGET